jgi:general secretion pathway protein A
MYTAHFGLKEPPFTITPDPRYLFMSERHREALAHLLYGAGEGGGFVQLTGEVGTGKTTLCRCLLEQLPPRLDVALILNPKLTSLELLAAVCDELRVPYPEGATSTKVLVDALSASLLDAHARGHRTIVIIDEAQDLSADVLEQIRLLTNLETAREKLLQIILIGQPELIDLLDREELRQVAQRITARYHLEPFTEPETKAYVRHRLQVAGRTRGIFTERAFRRVHRASGGIPRLINIICDRALLGAYAQDRTHIDPRMVSRAAAEVRGPRRRLTLGWRLAIAASVVAVAGLTAVVLAAKPFAPGDPASPAAASPAPAPSASSAPLRAPAAPAPRSVAAAVPARPASTSAAPAVAGSPAVPATPASRTPDAPPPPGSIVAAAVASEAAPKASPLAEILARPALPGDQASAFAAVYTRWGVQDAASKARRGCAAAGAEGLRCLARTGSWTRLRRYNVPAVLPLAGPSGARHFAAVLSLAERTATLAIRGQELSVPLREVEPFWDGDFVLLWRPPAVSTVPLTPGASSPDVDWLRQRLAALDGGTTTAGAGELYDGDLRDRVVTFQRNRSLQADGIVGEETLVQLTLASRPPGTPALAGSGL